MSPRRLKYLYHFPIEVGGETALLTYEGKSLEHYFDPGFLGGAIKLEDTDPSHHAYSVAIHSRVGNPVMYLELEDIKKDSRDKCLLRLCKKLNVERVYFSHRSKSDLEMAIDSIRENLSE